MIKPRTIARSIIIEYTGTPIFSLFTDGVQVVENQQLPTQTVRQTRRVLLPKGIVGYVHQVSFGDYEIKRHNLELEPVEAYSDFNLFHYYEITFDGTIDIQISVDEIDKLANARSQTLTMSTRGTRNQDTRKVYFPPLAYGYIPHIFQDLTTNTGRIHSARPVALPSRFMRGLRDHSEIQVSYQGFIDLEVYLDGRLISTFNLDAEINEDEFLTVKHYLPAASRGYALQWIQFGEEGEIAMFETDATLTDLQQPQQPNPV